MTTDQPQTDQALPLGTTWDFESEDNLFISPYLDVDEWRDAPVRHRYVHGGFEGTDSKFSFYFPEPHAYQGRFFQHVTPFPQSENLGPTEPLDTNKIAFANASGAFFVETNGGGAKAADPFAGVDPTVAAYRANAAVARFARVVAGELFGPRRVYGYLYGGSGGGYRTISSSENSGGAWDGYAPYVIGSSMAIPNVFCVRMHALRILRDRLPDIVDAYDAGGDPSALKLTDQEREALDEVSRMGFPLRSWFGWRTMDLHGFSALFPGVIAADPTYTSEFWTSEGYLGSDPQASIHQDRVRLHTTVVELIDETPDDGAESGGVDESFKASAQAKPARVVTALRLADTPVGWFLGAELRIVGGKAAGTVIRLSAVEDDIVRVEGWQGAVPADLAVGDEVVLDNSNFLAVQTYHRHQVPGPEFTVWDQFRDSKGEPQLPQRPMLLGPLMTQGATAVPMTGRIEGKMIVVACLLDREAFPWQADWYRGLVQEQLGGAADGQFRLWYVDNALHGDVGPQEFAARSVSYLGALETALRQLADWVEKGIEPATTSAYGIAEGQVCLPPDAGDRGGVQPVVSISVDGSSRADVHVGQSVAVRIEAEAVSGVVVELLAINTDAEGVETTGEPFQLQPAKHVAVETTRAFNAPGTYFLAVRVAAQTGGDATSPHARAMNIARARVVVHA
ncbi:hypothetical protein [Arthrobacter sp. W4I7]|uniref:hypothetical protein n=1 Tax=Arthrobacter sp. W4I7 TaxID=3042296 RepID=UPI00277D2B01|nr:hypothetical protein [Arthrobacter sp. W4I7]MDQ0691313.1 hypothetical protein [Arthrobacter sp. W4I7]